MEFLYDIYKLSDLFFLKYPKDRYPELMRGKGERPVRYVVASLTDFFPNIFICIPYRSNIKHKYSYKFVGSKRSLVNESGLDFSKMVLIQEEKFLENLKEESLDKDEYLETIKNISKILDGAIKYLNLYIEGLKNPENIGMDKHQFHRVFQYSTLPYFVEFLL